MTSRSNRPGMRPSLAVVLLVVLQSVATWAATGEELKSALAELRRLPLDRATTIAVDSLVLTQHDLRVELHSGRLAYLEPLRIDSVEHHVGAYFEGKGTLRFAPPVELERQQLQRFFDDDSLVRSFDRILILSSVDIRERIDAGAQPAKKPFKKKQAQQSAELLADFSDDDEQYYLFELLRNLAGPASEPLLLINVKPKRSDRLFVLFDPYRYEPLALWRRHSLPGETFMELVCSYRPATYAAATQPVTNQLRATHYDIDASLSSRGTFQARADVWFEMEREASRFATLGLHPDLKVTRVADSSGHAVAAIGHEKKRDNLHALYLIFDQPAAAGEPVYLSFDYEGEVVREELGYFYVTAGAQWYPAPPDRRRATFDLHFRTPKDYEFVATGTVVERDTVSDTIRSRWIVDTPAKNVSFSIGPMKHYTFGEAGPVPIDIYYSKELHEDLAYALVTGGASAGKNMERQVATDVIGALQLFSKQFGPYPHDRLSVTEILSFHGEAFPGFLHMGLPTWIQTDLKGEQRVFRAHEVAHQWWGVDVGYDTYRDQWLSEAFSEYSALLYLQSSEGTAVFLEMLRKYRDEIFSVRKYLLGSGESAGAVAMGYRAASTQTEEDYNLVIYKKGAYVLHMLRSMLIDLETQSEETFLGLMRDFYLTYRGLDATTADFRRLAEKHAGIDLGWFFDQWVFGMELPTYRFDYEVSQVEDGGYTVAGRVRSGGVSESFRMYVPIRVELETGARIYRRFLVDRPDFTFEITGLLARPADVRLNTFESVLAKVKD